MNQCFEQTRLKRSKTLISIYVDIQTHKPQLTACVDIACGKRFNSSRINRQWSMLLEWAAVSIRILCCTSYEMY